MRQDSNLETEPLLPEWLTSRLHRGWWVVVLGFFVLAVASRAQVETGFELLANLDRIRAAAGQEGFPTNTEYYLIVGVVLVLAPVIGFLVDRFGPSAVVVPVMVGTSITFAAESIVDEFWLQQLTWLVLWGSLGRFAANRVCRGRYVMDHSKSRQSSCGVVCRCHVRTRSTISTISALLSHCLLAIALRL